jgi:hypothetical protein
MQIVQWSKQGCSDPRTQLNFETPEGAVVLHYGWGGTVAYEETSNDVNRRLVTHGGNAESFAECENKGRRGSGYLKATNYPARLLFKARIASNVLHQRFRWWGRMEFRRS